MRLKKINLKNFKCFEDTEFELGGLNLLTGLNGMGKSTVLQSLLLLRQNFELKSLDERLALNGSLVQLGNSHDILYQYFKNSEISIDIEFQDRISAKWTWDGRSEGDHLQLTKSDIPPDLKVYSLFNNKFHYLNAERIGPRAYFETSSYAVKYENQIGIRGEYAANYLSEFQSDDIKIPALRYTESIGLSLYEQVNAWMSEIRPGTRVNVDSSTVMGLVALSFQFVGGGDVGNRFRPTNVGFGLSYILPLLVAVLSSEPGTLLLLENPEAHLHPRGQAQMGRFLALAAANGIQIIVESHSDHILNGIRVAVKNNILYPENTKLFFFNGEVIDRKYTHYIETPQIDKNGKLDYRPIGFFDEWDKQLTELI